jgi:hypothetical protein
MICTRQLFKSLRVYSAGQFAPMRSPMLEGKKANRAALNYIVKLLSFKLPKNSECVNCIMSEFDTVPRRRTMLQFFRLQELNDI